MKSDISAGRAYVTLGLKNSAFIKGLQQAQARLGSMGRGMSMFGAGVTAAGAAILAPMMKAINIFADTGDQLDKMRQRTGISVEALSELGHAADQSGASLQDVEAGVRKMQKELGKGGEVSEATAAAIEGMGLSVAELQAMSPEEQFNTLAAGIGKIGDPTKRAAVAMQLFGKSGTKLLPMIEDLDALRAEAREMGFTMSGESAASAVKLGDMIANLGKTVKFAAIAIGGELAPKLMIGVRAIQTIATEGLKWIKANGGIVTAIAAVGVGLVAAGTAITALGGGLIFASMAIGAFLSLLTLAAGALAFVVSPMGLVLAALAGLTTWFLTSTDAGQSFVAKLSSLFGTLAATAKQTIGGVMDAMSAGNVQLAAQIAFQGIRVALLEIVGKLQNDWKPFIDFVLGGWDVVKTVWNGVSQALVSTWKAVTSLLKDAWDAFTKFFGFGVEDAGGMFDGLAEGLVAAFTQATRFLVDIWAATVKRLTNMIIDFDPTGTFAKQHEKKKADAEHSLTSNRRQRDLAVASLAARRGEATPGFDREELDMESSEEKLRGTIQAAEDGIAQAQLAMGQTIDDFKADSKGYANTLPDATAKAIKESMDGLDKRAQARGQATAGDLTGVDDDLIGRERKRFEDMQEQARRAAEADRDKAKSQVVDAAGGFDSEQTKRSTVAITSSAAAFALQQGGGGGSDPVVAELRESRKTNEMQMSELIGVCKSVEQNLVIQW